MASPEKIYMFKVVGSTVVGCLALFIGKALNVENDLFYIAIPTLLCLFIWRGRSRMKIKK